MTFINLLSSSQRKSDSGRPHDVASSHDGAGDQPDSLTGVAVPVGSGVAVSLTGVAVRLG